MTINRSAPISKVILVHIHFPLRADQEDLDEFQVLANSAGAEICDVIIGTRSVPDAKYLIGSGKAKEVHERVLLHQPDVVLVNHALTPSQERNLERSIQCRVLDRTGLILDIFAQRARTFEGKLQVELAQLSHLATRLVRGWTHLERQKGGIGLRGPGETQLETDRRLLRQRIKTIQARLVKVRKQRDLSRRARRKAQTPTVALVGYTNAGKSSLFNGLTQGEVYVADKLFATLDPTMRRIELPGVGAAILGDTVGFIRHLPHDLVEAFSATLEETQDASLLLHVIDLSDPHWRDKVEEVEQVLSKIGASEVPQIRVLNKIDLIDGPIQAGVHSQADDPHTQVWVSVHQQLGLDDLLTTISQHLYGDPLYRRLCLSPNEGKLRAQLYALGAVLEEKTDDDGNWLLSIRIARADYLKLRSSS